LENNLGMYQENKQIPFDEKNRGRKSSASVPLRNAEIYSNRFYCDRQPREFE
jgi:hypothetical protein